MYDLFKRQRQKKSNLPPFPIKVKKKPSFSTNITAVISLSVEIPD